MDKKEGGREGRKAGMEGGERGWGRVGTEGQGRGKDKRELREGGKKGK